MVFNIENTEGITLGNLKDFIASVNELPNDTVIKLDNENKLTIFRKIIGESGLGVIFKLH